MNLNLLLIQLKNAYSRSKYIKNWYIFYLIYLGIIKKGSIKFSNHISCEISKDDLRLFYFLEQLFINKMSNKCLIDNSKVLENLGKSDFIFNCKSYKWYIKRGYEFDSVNEILQKFSEPDTFKTFSKFHGKLLVNVGANAGGYAIPASKKFKQVLALEPNPNVFYELNRNIKLNKIKNIKTLKIAAWSKKAKLELFSPKNRFGYGGQVSTLLPKSMEKEGISYNTHFSVNTITLNDLLRNQDTIDLLLIDAENAEVEILNGSDEILNKTKAIIIEVRDNTERTVKDILNNYGFNIKELDISKNSKNIFGKKY